jgi:hypothetical protein
MRMNLCLQSSRILGAILGAIFCATLALFLPGNAFAQSVSETKPTQLTSRETRATANYPARIGTGYSKTFYYYFNAGPGEVSAEVLTGSGTGDYRYSVTFQKAGSTVGHIDFNFSGWGENVRNTSFSLTTNTKIIMAVKLTGRFDYDIRLGGAIDIPIATIGPLMRRGPTETRLAVPAGGRLLIRMRDGSTQEFDLSLVREVVVIR